MGSHLSNLIKVRSKKKMAKLTSLLVTLLIIGTFFEGNALRCFKGHGTSYEGLPKLVACKGIEYVCASDYAKTDIYSEHGLEITAGTWRKSCFRKSELPFYDFGDGASDRCIEIKFHDLKSGKLVACICRTDGCNQQIELEDDQTLAEAAAAAEAKAKAEAEEAEAAAATAEAAAAAEAKAKAEAEEAARLAAAALMDVTNK